VQFFELAGLTGEHTVRLPNGGTLNLTAKGQITCTGEPQICTEGMTMLTALSTDENRILSLSWYAYWVELQVVNGKVQATYCEATTEKGCTRSDLAPISFE
jgi:hypothetical protein